MFINLIPLINSEYKPDLLIIIKDGKVRKACLSDKANKYQLSRLLWQMSKELDKR